MKRIILMALIFGLVAAARAQYKKPFFQTLSVESGLPEATIMSSLQDRLGYMWLGTLNGLVRYDGYQVKLYSVLNDDGLPVSLSTASYLYEDRAGKLWAFFFQEGLYYLDRSKDAFVKVTLDKQSLNKLKGADYFRKWIEDKQQPHFHWLFTHYAIEDLHHVYLFDDMHNTMEDYSASCKGNYYIPMIHGGADIAQDANGKIWIIADSLLSYFDWDTRSFQPVFVLPDSSKKYMFSVITQDPADGNVLWLNTWIPNYTGTSSPSKFIRFNTKTKTYKIFTPADIDPGLPATSYKQIFTDSLKRVWISTNNAIALYNNSSGTFTNFHLQAAASNSDINVRSIASDTAGNLWIGTEFRGVFYLDVKKAGITHYPSVGNPVDLTPYKLFLDRAGTLWINEPDGISWLDRERSLLNPTSIGSFHSSKGRQADPDQYHTVGTANDSIFFVTDSSGLFLWNHRQNSFTKMKLKVKSSSTDIASVIQEKDGTMWIGTYNDGLIRFDPSTNTQKNYRYNAKDTLSISSDYIFSLVIDKTGTLWICTGNKGVCKLNKGNGVFTRLPFIQNNNTIEAAGVLDDNHVESSYLDKAGILWIGTTFGGLNRIEPATGKITSFLDYKKGFFAVTAIHEDHLERLWAGSYVSGLFLVGKKTGSLIKYTVQDGLINNSVLGIKEDNKGNIWVTTIGGLSMLDPEKKQFKNYPMQIPFLNRLFVKESNGLFDIITKKGLLSFDPAQINKSSVPPTVIIESVSYHTANNKDTVLFTDGRNNAKLKYNENRISFNYVALHYEHADRNQYAYKLDGYDKDWIPAGTQRTITYTNLSPDTYTFHVKAANSDGVWNETGASFVITILPPFWETWWFRVLSVIALIIVIYAIIRERSRKLKAENLLLEEKVTERTVQLKKSLEDLKATQSQLIQSEKMASLGELTAGIAHEIQNPLNFVNNFSEVNREMIVELKDEIDKGNYEEVKLIANDIKDNEEKIIHHGKRADAIVKGMLQHSKQTSGIKEATDINALCDEYLRLSYHGLRAKDKSFNADFKTELDESIGKINIVPQDIGRVILNLINNAFYAVNEKLTAHRSPLTDDYKPLVSVQTKKLNDKVEIRVKDNGNGIPQNIIDKIFQPFFTTKPTGQGTGLGLSLAYDIIKAHGGEIKVKTKEGEGLPGEQTGTEFIIWLPIV